MIQKLERLDKRWILVLVFLVIIGFAIRLNTKTCIYGWDQSVYMQHAEIIGGFKQDNFNEFNFRSPFFPVLIAGAFHIYHNPISANILLAVFGSLTIVLAYLLGAQMFSRRVGIISALLLTFWPIHVMFSKTILVHVPALFFCMLAFYLLKLGESRKKDWMFLLSAVVMGLAFVTRLTYIFVIPLFLINIWLFRKEYNWKRLFLLAAGLSLVVLPYLYLNHYYFGDFLYQFKESRQLSLWAESQPISMYFPETLKLLGSAGGFGLLLWFFRKQEEKISKNEIFLGLFALVLIIIMTVMLHHKEARYIFVALLAFMFFAGLGFDWAISRLKKRWLVFAVLLLAVIISVPSAAETYDRIPCDSWLAETVDYVAELPEGIIYAHHYYTNIAYKTDKPVVLAPWFKDRFFNQSDDYMNRSGYYVYFLAQSSQFPVPGKIEQDSRFEEIARFGAEENAVVYRYTAP